MGEVVEAGAVVQQGLTALIPPTLRPPIDDAPIVAPCTPACTVALRSEAARGCEDVGLRSRSAETPGVSAPKFEWNVGREVVPPWSESGSERGCRNRQRPLRGRGSAISCQRRYVSRPTFRKRAQCNAAFCTAGGGDSSSGTGREDSPTLPPPFAPAAANGFASTRSFRVMPAGAHSSSSSPSSSTVSFTDSSSACAHPETRTVRHTHARSRSPEHLQVDGSGRGSWGSAAAWTDRAHSANAPSSH